MIDFHPWDALLRQYVDERGRVDYQAWQQEKPQAIFEWISSLDKCNINLDERSNLQLALWLNLYNAFTISTILESYPIDSILPKIFGIPNWLAFLLFFSSRKYLFLGRRYSLGEIERDILQKKFQEPRIHFAIVCASLGCPLLRNGAYLPDRVQEQLDEDASRFINNPDKVSYDSESGTVYCSKIFKWYRQDFLKVSPSVQEYIRSYLETDLPLTASTPIRYLYYDWNLNQRISS